jgi:Ca2+-binding EF-hand superfamily protein
MFKTSIITVAAVAVIAFGASSAFAQDQQGGGQGNWGGGQGGRGGGMLARYDTDHDGKISLAEYEAGRTMSFKRMDTDGNGSLSFAEIDAATAAAQQRGGPMADMMKARNDALKAADANGDQSISADEFKAYVDAEFKTIDTDNDGYLTPDEMQAAMSRRR